MLLGAYLPFLGWIPILGYLTVAGMVLWGFWCPQRRSSPLLLPLLAATITCHFLYLLDGLSVGRLKLDSPETVAIVLGWMVALVALGQLWWKKMEAQLGFLLPFSAILLAFGVFERPTQLSPELRRDILLVHVALMTGGYLMLTLSFATVVTHLFSLWSLKRKRSLILLKKFPPLEVTEKLTGQLLLLGFPLLVLGMIVGIVWAQVEGRGAWSDPKVIFSILTGSVFAIYLYARFVLRWKAAVLHWLIVAGFVCLSVTFLIVRHTLSLG